MENWLFDGLIPQHSAHQEAIFLSDLKGQSYSYQQFEKATAKAANALLSIGLKPNDRVAVQVDKSPAVVILYLATIRAGGIFLPLNSAYVSTEIEYFLEDAAPLLFVCDPTKQLALSTITQAQGIQVYTMDPQGEGSWFDLCRTQADSFKNVERGADDLASILYTSGTTGRSKGAMLSHDNLLSNAITLVKTWHYVETDVLLHALPVYHTHGLFVAINITLIAGASLIYLQRYDSNLICDYLPDSTVMMGVPTFYTRLMENKRFCKALCEKMRLFISGSAPLLAEHHRQFESQSGQVILERYGMTETNMITSNPYDGIRKAGTVGRPLTGVDVRIIDQSSGKILNNNETGMIQVKGDNVFKGYWNMPEKTAEEFTEDGFFITGDLGQWDVDGYVSIVGRDKDLIISGGLNIYPKDIELVINTSDEVIESAVIGIADSDFGEAVIAIVVCLNDVERAKSDIEKIVKSDLAGFKRPKQLFFVTELPRNAMGKVQKNQLRETYSTVS